MTNSPTPMAAEWDHFALRIAEKVDRANLHGDDIAAMTDLVYVLGNLNDEDRVLLTFALARHLATIISELYPGDVDARWRHVYELYPPA